jgi:alpha-beta hydrolase superfamily lysophospholipase
MIIEPKLQFLAAKFIRYSPIFGFSSILHNMKWIKRLLIAFLVLYLGVCGYMYFFQEKLLFHPYKLAVDYKYNFPGKFREFNLDIGNGCTANALQFYADSPAKGVVLYFHGNSEAIDRTGTLVGSFTSRGYDCIVMDYPSYGKSTGELTEENLFNTGSKFIDLAKKSYSSSNIIIYGKSLGTGIATYAARYSAWYKALILEAPYYSIVDIGQRRYPYLPVGLLSRYPISTYQYLKDLHHPVYAIHGTDDNVIPIASPRRFLDLKLPVFSLTVVQGAHHGDLAKYKEYDQLLDKVLN